MNATLESRKIDLVQHFLNLDNIEVISKIEALLNDESNRISKKDVLKPFKKNEINKLLNQAEDEFKKGEFYSSNEVKSLINSWE